ncbi:putative ribonuclease H-like domain-containing protein [Tanacetum coccineum]
MGLESLEARIVVHENNEVDYEENITFLKYDAQVKDISIKELKSQLENTLKEKDDLKLKLENFETSSKNLTKLMNSQISAKDKTGLGYDSHVNESEVLNNVADSVFDSHESDGDNNQVNDRFKKSEGYHVVPPPYTGYFNPARADLSFAGLDKSISLKCVKLLLESDSDDDCVIRPLSDQNKPSCTKINFVKPVENTRKYVFEQHTYRQAKNLRKSQDSWVDKRNWNGIMTQKLGNGFEFKKKACFVCGSLNHLIKDCNFYENKMVGKSVLNNEGKVTGQREVRPVWNNAQRVNHQNKLTHPHPRRNFVPSPVITNSRKVPVNTAKPIVNGAKPSSNIFHKSHSPVRRTFTQKAAPKNSVLKGKVNTAKVNHVTTVGPKAVVSAAEGNGKNVSNPQYTLQVATGHNLTQQPPLTTATVCTNSKGALVVIVTQGGLTCLFEKATIDESNLWHRRLDYVNFKTMNKLVRGNLVRVSVRSINKKTYCLVVIDDFSRFSWVFFLATKDETPEILKNFITGIENQINHKKGIKKEFSVARTPQQNGVAERKNRTLIETARTMLADSKLPTTFWAEAVNTACYVQNRVDIWVPVTILNTVRSPKVVDGKLKSDDGFFVGYSINIFAENQTNGHACTKANIDAKQAGKKTVPGPQYVLLPFLTSDSQSPKSSEDKVADDDDRKKNGVLDPAKEVNVVSSSFTTVDPGRERNQRNEFESVFGQDKDTNGNSSCRMFTHVYVVGSSYENLGGSTPVNAATFPNDDLPTNPLMLDLEDTADVQDNRIFTGAYDDEDVGAKADLNNLETTMNVSPIPITRIHKDHPKEQIIVDINSATQTRRMTKMSEEHAMVSYINKQRRTNHKDYQNCLFSCFLSQIEPKKVIQALTDPRWVEAMQEELHQNKKDERGIVVRNKARLVAQGPKKKELIMMRFLLLLLGYKQSGLQVKQKDDGIFISQDKYVADILKKFDFVTMKTASTPIETNKALLKDEEAEDVDVHLYRSMIGSLMYLTAFRPNIIYLKGQSKLGLWYPRDSPFDLEAFFDSDYAGASLDRKSTTGGCQFLGKKADEEGSGSSLCVSFVRGVENDSLIYNLGRVIILAQHFFNSCPLD